MEPRSTTPLLHPLSLAAIALLAVNDHWLKDAHGGWWTGKLSDVAGLVFFPLLLHALWEYAARWRGGLPSAARSRRALVIACAATAAVFAAVQLLEPAADAYRIGLAALQWPVRAVLALAQGAAVPELGRVHLTRDPTDLVALPALGVALWIGWAYRPALRSRSIAGG